MASHLATGRSPGGGPSLSAKHFLVTNPLSGGFVTRHQAGGQRSTRGVVLDVDLHGALRRTALEQSHGQPVTELLLDDPLERARPKSGS